MTEPLNQILFGPPGTGKTYATIDAALKILDPALWAQNSGDRKVLKARFDALVKDQRVRFVTFHQSFSYEDFVEGLRATTDDETKQLRYEVMDGVFKSICNTAEALAAPQKIAAAAGISLKGRRVWKMSLGDTQGPDAVVYDECMDGGYILLGYGSDVDFSGCTTRQAVAAKYQQSGINIGNAQYDYAVTSVLTFAHKMAKGDLVVVTDGNLKFRAIGEITGDYEFEPHISLEGGYSQKRAVRWLRDYTPSVPYTELMKKQFSQMTLYELQPSSIDLEKLQRLLNAPSADDVEYLPLGTVGSSEYVVTKVTDETVELMKPNGNQLPFSRTMLDVLAHGVNAGVITIDDIRNKQAVAKLPGKGLEPFLVNGYQNILALLVQKITTQQASGADVISDESHASEARVLIIDEINRGNIARIFGELITLLEPSKRAGSDEALEVMLPYSKQPFSVPKNVYLIGTMNTADRSLSTMDVALRRRFVFKEMQPQPRLLKGLMVEGIAMEPMLSTLNQRIEALLDRDHCLGHAYFLPLHDDPSIDRLGRIFRHQVLPLLQEYFFDDWQRIQWVLNDHRKPGDLQFVQSEGVSLAKLFGNHVDVARNPQSWKINEEAFERTESYLGIVSLTEEPNHP